jgi:hypothetical protein
MKKLLNFRDFSALYEKYSGDHAKELGIENKEEWAQIDPTEHPELSGEFFDLIKTAYKEIGGHLKVQTPADVFKNKKWTYWKAVDLHDDPDIDLVIFGKETKFGIKSVGVGHDGKKDSKKEFLDSKAQDLSTMGFYSELSGKLSEIMLKKYKVPHVRDEEKVREILGKKHGPNIKWHGKHPHQGPSSIPGDGWYSRKIAGKWHAKIMLGNPTI